VPVRRHFCGRAPFHRLGALAPQRRGPKKGAASRVTRGFYKGLLTAGAWAVTLLACPGAVFSQGLRR
jgi:hypothetical protein